MKTQFIILTVCVVASFALQNRVDESLNSIRKNVDERELQKYSQAVGESTGHLIRSSEATTRTYSSVDVRRQQNENRRLWFKQGVELRRRNISEISNGERRNRYYPMDWVKKQDVDRLQHHHHKNRTTATTTPSTTTSDAPLSDVEQ